MHPKLRSTYRTFLQEVARKLIPCSPHFDIEVLCNKLGVKIVKVSREDYRSATLVNTQQGYEILIPQEHNKKQLSPFQRFLIAHELGHLLLEREYSTGPISQSDYWQYEELCDYFARLILLPEDYIEDKIRTTASNPRDRLGLSSYIARDAQVPWPAVAHRIVECDSKYALFRIIIIPSSDRLKFLLNVSTLKDKEFQKSIFYNDDNELGRLLCRLKNNSFLPLHKSVLDHPSVIKKFPIFQKAIQGGAIRLKEDEIRLIVQFS